MAGMHKAFPTACRCLPCKTTEAQVSVASLCTCGTSDRQLYTHVKLLIFLGTKFRHLEVAYRSACSC